MNPVFERLKNICKRRSLRRDGASICSEAAFNLSIQRERARADRGHGLFSMVLFNLLQARTPSSDRQLIKILKNRIRNTDCVGWADTSSIGVLLADTSREGGQVFLNDILMLIKDFPVAPECRIYTYPTEDAEAGDCSLLAEQPVGTDATGTEKVFNEMLAVRAPLWRRIAERALAGLALLLLAPLLLLIAAAIKCSSPGPALYRQMRVGYKGKEFCCYKFRSMHLNADTEVHEKYFKELIEVDKPMSKLDAGEDPRIFRLGRLLRSSSLDELPQLLNVLKGEMSLIGPRPCIPGEYRSYLPWHRHRVDALPGLTGLWQVSGKNRTTFAEMMRFDTSYSRHKSLKMDLGIVLKTPQVILRQFMEDRHFKGLFSSRSGEPARETGGREGRIDPEKMMSADDRG